MLDVGRLRRMFMRRRLVLNDFAQIVLSQRPLVVVDVGALGGLLPELAPIDLYVDAVGFDPDPDECDRLNAEARERGVRQRYLPYAVTGRDEPRTFHVLRKEASSSLLEPNREYHDRFPDATRMDVMRRVDVETRALGPLLAAEKANAEFLKLDAHGVENEILASLAPEQWAGLLAAHVELLVAPHYVGQTGLGEVHDVLRANDLELFSLKRYSARRAGFDASRYRSRGQLAFADALYLRRASGLSSEQRARLMVIAASFHHFDFAYELAGSDEAARSAVLALAPSARSGGPWASDGADDWI